MSNRDRAKEIVGKCLGEGPGINPVTPKLLEDAITAALDEKEKRIDELQRTLATQNLIP